MSLSPLCDIKWVPSCRLALNISRGCSSLVYYYKLHSNNCKNLMHELYKNNTISVSPMSKCYREIVNLEKSCIYNSFTDDYHPSLNTRWRYRTMNIGWKRGDTKDLTYVYVRYVIS